MYYWSTNDTYEWHVDFRKCSAKTYVRALKDAATTPDDVTVSWEECPKTTQCAPNDWTKTALKVLNEGKMNTL